MNERLGTCTDSRVVARAVRCGAVQCSARGKMLLLQATRMHPAPYPLRAVWCGAVPGERYCCCRLLGCTQLPAVAGYSDAPGSLLLQATRMHPAPCCCMLMHPAPYPLG